MLKPEAAEDPGNVGPGGFDERYQPGSFVRLAWATPWCVSPTGTSFIFSKDQNSWRSVSMPSGPPSPNRMKSSFVTGSAVTPKPDDLWGVRGRGLVFSH